jgi:hypothetical protein
VFAAAVSVLHALATGAGPLVPHSKFPGAPLPKQAYAAAACVPQPSNAAVSIAAAQLALHLGSVVFAHESELMVVHMPLHSVYTDNVVSKVPFWLMTMSKSEKAICMLIVPDAWPFAIVP